MSNQISEEAWNAQRDTIISLFIEQDISSSELVGILADRGFRASKGQLDRQLRKWKISKNISQRQWKSIIKTIKRRQEDSRLSEVWFQGRRLNNSRLQKAIQRYDLLRFSLSAAQSPSPGPMEDIRVCTPPRYPGTEMVLVRRSKSPYGESDGENQQSSLRRVIMEGLPSLEFQSKLEALVAPWFLRGPSQISGHQNQILQETFSAAANCLCSMKWRSQRMPPMISYNISEQWHRMSPAVADFPIPLRTLDLNSDLDSYLWSIEFMVIGSANGYLRPYEDQTLDLLLGVTKKVETLDEFLFLVGKYDFYVIIEKILDLQTTTSTLFGGQALLSGVILEDERLIEILLSRKVPLDEFRSGNSAIHLAVENQSERIIRRLLNGGIDPDGYTASYSDFEGTPLWRLLELFLIKQDTRVTHVSKAVVHVIFSSKITVHSVEECRLYWALLFVKAWQADATQFLEALCCYYETSNALAFDFLCCTETHSLAHRKDFSTIAHKIFVNISLPYDEDVSSFGPRLWLLAAIRKRKLPLVKSLIVHYPDAWRSLGDSMTKFDVDKIHWLLQSPIDLSGHLGALLLAAMQLGNLHLCQVFIDRDPRLQALEEMADSLRLLGSDILDGLRDLSDLSHKQILSLILPRMAQNGICSWVPALRKAYEECGHGELFQTLAQMCLARPLSDLQQDLFRLTLHAFGGYSGLQILQMFLKVIEQKSWQIEWSQLWDFELYLNNDTWVFQGDLPFLQELVNSGLPLEVKLFMACAKGSYWGQTLPFITRLKPSLVTELTDQDIIGFLSHFDDSCQTEKCLCYWACSCHEAIQILDWLLKNGATITDKWLIFGISTKGKINEFLTYGLPCSHCTSYKETSRCMNPLVAATWLGDTDILQKMIREGFEVRRTFCKAKNPLCAAIDKQRLDLVQILLKAGADVNPAVPSNTAPLCTAVWLKELDQIQVLLKAGADVNLDCLSFDYREHQLPLQNASRQGHFKIVCSLLEAGADPSRGTGKASSLPLALAASYGHLDIVELLMANFSDAGMLKQQCKGAAKVARRFNRNFIARLLEEKAEALTDQVGVDDTEYEEEDDAGYEDDDKEYEEDEGENG